MPQTSPKSPSRTTSGAALVAVDGRAYPLRSAGIVARAAGGLAFTTLTQEFDNPHAEPLEVIYTLPLPADGAVIGYAIRMGERVIRGEIEKREVARASYDRALFEGRTAGLLEQDRDDTFTQRLGSVPPGQRVRVEIEVLQPLAFVPADEGGSARWEYRFPTVVGVRYEGGPGRVPDADRLDVDRAGDGEIPTRVALDLTVADGTPAAIGVTSSTHDVACEAEGGAARVRLRNDARLDRDLVVRWDACSDGVGVGLVEGPGLAGDDGRYGLLTLTPPAVPGRTQTRDVTVLIDASGSMSGEPLVLAKEVVAGLLRSLDAGDRFELIAFASTPDRLTRGMRAASRDEIREALQKLAGLEAGGGTEMTTALVEALAPMREDSQRQVVLVTDGEIGFESQVVGEILRRLPANGRIHTVGVGSAPNRSLTGAVARAGRGVEVFATDTATAAEAAGRLCRATARPVLTELSVGGDAVRGHAPGRPRDVFAGQPLVLALELTPPGGTLEVRGRQAGTKETWIWHVRIPAATAGEPEAAPEYRLIGATAMPLGALYGREVIADLEMEAAAEVGSHQAIEARIESAGLRHRITSRMTSLVAVADEPSADPKLPRRRERLSVELPRGVSAEGSGLMGGRLNHMALMSPMMRLGKIRGAGLTLQSSLRQHDAVGDVAASYMRSMPWDRLSAPSTPIEVRVDGGRLVRSTPDGFVVEFETPFEGFVMPAGEVNLWLDGAVWLLAAVVPGKSTPRGPHRAGLIVRLALFIPGHPEWSQAGSIDLRWLSSAEGEAGARSKRQITLSIAVPREGRGAR